LPSKVKEQGVNAFRVIVLAVPEPTPGNDTGLFSYFNLLGLDMGRPLWEWRRGGRA
jgi:hypothetical protein